MGKRIPAEQREVQLIFAAKVLEAVPAELIKFIEDEAKQQREGATRANHIWEMAQKLKKLRVDCLSI